MGVPKLRAIAGFFPPVVTEAFCTLVSRGGLPLAGEVTEVRCWPAAGLELLLKDTRVSWCGSLCGPRKEPATLGVYLLTPWLLTVPGREAEAGVWPQDEGGSRVMPRAWLSPWAASLWSLHPLQHPGALEAACVWLRRRPEARLEQRQRHHEGLACTPRPECPSSHGGWRGCGAQDTAGDWSPFLACRTDGEEASGRSGWGSGARAGGRPVSG